MSDQNNGPQPVEVTPDYATIEGLPEFPKARNMGDPMAIVAYCEHRIAELKTEPHATSIRAWGVLKVLVALIMADVNQATEDLERTRQC